jgi:D-glycero-D-manno-heptose 1,7-bisphosphate phosphatase
MLVMLDRDGVLNEERTDYVKSPGELVMIARSAEAVARLNAASHKVAVVSNQSAVGRGIINEAMLARIHDKLRGELARAGAKLDLLLYCPDPPWAESGRRKPRPGMLLEALSHFRTRSENAIMIGDSLRDLEAAKSAGCRRILVRTGKGAETQGKGLPTHLLPIGVYNDLADAVDGILGSEPVV